MRKEQSDARYLSITLRDNDFTSSLMCVANMLYKEFRYHLENITEDDLPELEKYIQHIWYATHNICGILHYTCRSKESVMLLFEGVKCEIINFLDIPEWDNAETVYIPLFECDGAEIILR